MPLSANVRWSLHRMQQAVHKRVRLPFRTLPSETADRYTDVSVTGDVPIAMRDGTRLFANIFKPAGGAIRAWPTVLIRMPYGKDESYCYMPAHGKYWARKGYACVIQDVRGRWRSEGAFSPMVNERDDGIDTLDWVAAQPWCDGNIGMTGESYYGYTQWAVATAGHSSLKCIAPGNTSPDIYRHMVYNGGAFCLQTLGLWAYQINGKGDRNGYLFDPWHLPLAGAAEAAGWPSRAYSEWLDHPLPDEYWSAINVHDGIPSVDIPVMHWGGWQDVFLKGTLDSWRDARAVVQLAARDDQWLVVSAIDHELTPEFRGTIGRTRLSGQGWAHDRIGAFFDHWLRDGDTDLRDQPRVRLFVPGANEWRYEETWPPPGTEFVDLFLRGGGRAHAADGDGRLDREPPAAETPDRYTYDPVNPVTGWLGRNIFEWAKELADRRPLEARFDVLVYTSEPVTRDLEITGPLAATLYVSSSAPETDFTVALVDVYQDGYAQLVQEGILRTSARNGDRTAPALEPQTVYELDVDLWATSHVFGAGHRIRVEVSSSNFDRYDRNLNTGGRLAIETGGVAAHQMVFHQAEYPSRITLPIAPAQRIEW